ncbi:MAG: D-alanyl-D-alanine dipeptidase [Bacillota bacterium]
MNQGNRTAAARLLLALIVVGSLVISGCARPAVTPVAPTPGASAPGPAVTPPAAEQPEPPAQTVDPSSGATTPSPDPSIKEVEGLVDVTQLDNTFVIELRYATEDNFTGKKIYTEAKCLLMRGTAEKLAAANREFAEMGYRLKIWDAYRPLSAQQTLWDVVSDRSFVADPKKGSIHNRGAAVDVTLVDNNGNELPMPTGFDDFSEKASITYDGCSEEEARNRELLAEVMMRNGFVRYDAEWWHFTDSDAGNYPLLDVQFDEFDD